MLFNIDFRDLHALISLRKFFKNGGDLLAGSAPLRPEIQQNGLAGLEHITLKGGITDGFNRVVFTHSIPFFLHSYYSVFSLLSILYKSITIHPYNTSKKL